MTASGSLVDDEQWLAVRAWSRQVDSQVAETAQMNGPEDYELECWSDLIHFAVFSPVSGVPCDAATA